MVDNHVEWEETMSIFILVVTTSPVFDPCAFMGVCESLEYNEAVEESDIAHW